MLLMLIVGYLFVMSAAWVGYACDEEDNGNSDYVGWLEWVTLGNKS